MTFERRQASTWAEFEEKHFNEGPSFMYNWHHLRQQLLQAKIGKHRANQLEECSTNNLV